MERKIFIYDAFTLEKFKGNPAGVVFDADDLSENQMQNIAKELNFPETVFIFFKSNDIIRVRFFTPKEEINLCGHATIAYVTALIENKKIKIVDGENKIYVKTNLGIFPIIIEMDKSKIKNIMMYQDSPQIDRDKIFSVQKIADLLGISEEEIDKNIKIVKAYTGVWDLMIPVKNTEILSSLVPKMNEISKFSKENDIISFHIFTLTKDGVEVRNLAPVVNIPEEAATGTSNGALAYYLYNIGILEKEKVLKIKQGKSLNRESEIYSKIIFEKDKLEVLVGGNAVKLIEGYIEL